MKYLHNLFIAISALFLFACQAEEELGNGKQTGYLRLTVVEEAGVNTRAVPTDYKPKQIALQIVDEKNSVVKKTEDAELWNGKRIELPVGTYTVKASSNGFDGKDTGFDIPYYAGSKKIMIEQGGEANETITCTLANVKVSAIFDKTLLSKVKSVVVKVRDAAGTYSAVNFTQTETRSAYFPVTDLNVSVTVVNNEGESNSMTEKLEKVKARDHYKLNIRLQETGSDDLSVEVDPTTHEYSYTFYVSTKPSNDAAVNAAAWDRLAYLTAKDIMVESGVSEEGIKFQYRKADSKSEEDWVDVAATEKNGKYTAFATGLEASTNYLYRLVNGADVVIKEGTNLAFTTGAVDAKTVLYNGNFDLWTQGSADKEYTETIYPGSSDEAGNETCFWNSSNPGTTQGVGALGGAINVTTGVSSPVNTDGGQAAQLKSAYKIIAFAAASLYTGDFLGLSGMSANMRFGKPFTSRPIALHGYYQYTPVVINHVDRVPEGVTIESGVTMDQCAIFIALATEAITFNNGDEDSFIDYANDPRIIAYGELPSGDKSVATEENGYTEFTIPLRYKEDKFDTQPTHIIIVCSASKYGDYMTGGEGSTMYVDDFSLIYDGEPLIWE